MSDPYGKRMARLVIKLTSEERERFTAFVQNQQVIESQVFMGPYCLMNVVGSKEEFVQLKAGLSAFTLEVVRELCHGKCRDGSDCLNTARYGVYCLKHEPKG